MIIYRGVLKILRQHPPAPDNVTYGTARALPARKDREGGRPCSPSRENVTHAASGYPTLPQPHMGPKSCARSKTPRHRRRREEVVLVGRAWAATTLGEVV